MAERVEHCGVAQEEAAGMSEGGETIMRWQTPRQDARLEHHLSAAGHRSSGPPNTPHTLTSSVVQAWARLAIRQRGVQGHDVEGQRCVGWRKRGGFSSSPDALPRNTLHITNTPEGDKQGNQAVANSKTREIACGTHSAVLAVFQRMDGASEDGRLAATPARSLLNNVNLLLSHMNDAENSCRYVCCRLLQECSRVRRYLYLAER